MFVKAEVRGQSKRAGCPSLEVNAYRLFRPVEVQHLNIQRDQGSWCGENSC